MADLLEEDALFWLQEKHLGFFLDGIQDFKLWAVIENMQNICLFAASSVFGV